MLIINGNNKKRTLNFYQVLKLVLTMSILFLVSTKQQNDLQFHFYPYRIIKGYRHNSLELPLNSGSNIPLKVSTMLNAGVFVNLVTVNMPSVLICVKQHYYLALSILLYSNYSFQIGTFIKLSHETFRKQNPASPSYSTSPKL